MGYCYFQGFLDHGQKDRLKISYEILKDYIWKYLKLFHTSRDGLIHMVYENPDNFFENKRSSFKGVGYYIERESFQDFIRNIKFYE